MLKKQSRCLIILLNKYKSIRSLKSFLNKRSHKSGIPKNQLSKFQANSNSNIDNSEKNRLSIDKSLSFAVGS